MKLFNKLLDIHNYTKKMKILIPFLSVCLLMALGYGSYMVSAQIYSRDNNVVQEKTLVSPANDAKTNTINSTNNTVNDVSANNTNSTENNSVEQNSTSNSSSNVTNTKNTTPTKTQTVTTQQNTVNKETQPVQQPTNTASSTQQTTTQQSHGNLVPEKKPYVYKPTAQEIQTTRDRKIQLENDLKDLQNQLAQASSKQDEDMRRANGRPNNNDINAINKIQYQINSDLSNLKNVNSWLSEYDK